MYKKKEKKVTKYRKRFNTRHVKTKASYSLETVSALLGVHPNTVRVWIKVGLKTVDDHRPILIFGQDLVDYLNAKNRSHKRPCAETELFCCKCQKPRVPCNGVVQIKITPGRVNLRGVCNACGTLVHKAISPSKIEWYKTLLTVTEVHGVENL